MSGAERYRYDAVVFDLFGTLVPEFTRTDWEELLGLMASALGVAVDDLRRVWEETSIERQTGVLGDMPASLGVICERLGISATEEQMAGALAARARTYEREFQPLPHAEEILRWMKEDARLPIALISMCGPDTPALWRSSSLARYVDVEVFSCEVGMRKPHPEIYRHAGDRMGVDLSRCLYVGDGAYGELNGAAAVGMDPVLIRREGEEEGAMVRPEVDTWEGRRIRSLRELRSLLLPA